MHAFGVDVTAILTDKTDQQIAIAAAGAIKTIVLGMIQHTMSERMQVNGTGLLASLAANDGAWVQ